MGTISVLRREPEPARATNSIKFPLFRRVLARIQERQNEIYNKKLKFLLNQAFQYFLDESDEILLAPIDIPYFMYEKQRRDKAYNEAVKALLDVVKDKRVDECYRKRVKQLKEEVKSL